MTDRATVWIQLSDSVADGLGIPRVPFPVTADTAALLEAGTVDLAAIALDMSAYVESTTDEDQKRVLGAIVPTLAFVAAMEFMTGDEPALAANMIDVALRHRPDDPRLLAYRGLNKWDDGRRYEGLESLLAAVEAYGARDFMAPMLWLLTARALAEAGRVDDALALLGEVAKTEPREPRFWDLVDDLEQAAAVDDRGASESPGDVPVVQPVPMDMPPPSGSVVVATEAAEPARTAASSPLRRRRIASAVLLLVVGAGGIWLGLNLAEDDTPGVATEATAPETTVTPDSTPISVASTTTTTTTTVTTTTVAPTTTIAVFAVPPVTGSDETDAVTQLEALGLVAAVEKVESYDAEPGTVLSTDPTGSTELRAGETVTLSIATRPVECNDRPAEIPVAGFDDVAALSEEATDALDWAAAVGLVSVDTSFRPRDFMTRAGGAVVLWRYLCEPSLEGAATPFTDVGDGAFFAPAVEWAFTAGIVGGTTPTTFSPDDPISRAAFITIVWRALGEPIDDTPLAVTDVDPAAFYAPAIRWAFGAGLVSGTNADTFAPDAPLDRITTVILFDRIERLVDPLVAGP